MVGFYTKDDCKSARAREKEIYKVLSDDRETAHLIPTWQDIDVLESIQAALGPLTDFTDMLSGENFVTMSTILPVLHILKNEVLKDRVRE